MKKLLLFFTLVAIAAMSAECKKNLDADCIWLYLITNETGSVVKYVNDAVEYVDQPSVILIPPGSTVQIHKDSMQLGPDDNLKDLYENGLEELMSSFPPAYCSLYIGDEIIPETVWRRSLWSFESKRYGSTYTLILTDKLVESLKNS